MMKRQLKKLKNKKGASLVEVMVAVGVMVVVFAGLLQTFLYSTLLSEMSGNITLAVNEAQSKIEEIRGHEFDDIVTDYGSTGTPGDTFTLTVVNGAGQITVTQLNTDLLQIDVAVNWTERNNRAMSTTLSTLLAKRN